MILLIIVAKLSFLGVCRGPGYTSGNSGTLTKCNRKKLQHAKSATGEEFKIKTLQRVKVQHQIEQNIKRVQHKNITIQKSAAWDWCSMKKVQHEKSAS